MPNLYYYFNKQSSFYFNLDYRLIFGGDSIQITMPNNNSSQTIFNVLEDDNSSHYYTLNTMYITLAFTDIGQYQLVLEGNRNDYTNNNTDKIMIMIPIYINARNTIEGADSPITKMNNIYLSNIFQNMRLEETYNFSFGNNQVGSDENTIDMNMFLTGNTAAFYFPKIVDSNTNYKLIIFKRSNLVVNLTVPNTNVLLASLTKVPRYSVYTENSKQMKNIIVETNGMAITSTTETDIYIDCSPTNNIGEAVDIYTSKDMDQLKLFKINDVKVWAFRFVTIFIILLIIFVIIKIFQVSINGTTDRGLLNLTSTGASTGTSN
jgi:hypothetical protein